MNFPFSLFPFSSSLFDLSSIFLVSWCISCATMLFLVAFRNRNQQADSVIPDKKEDHDLGNLNITMQPCKLWDCCWSIYCTCYLTFWTTQLSIIQTISWVWHVNICCHLLYELKCKLSSCGVKSMLLAVRFPHKHNLHNQFVVGKFQWLPVIDEFGFFLILLSDCRPFFLTVPSSLHWAGVVKENI